MKHILYIFAIIFSVCASHAEDLDTVWTHDISQYQHRSLCARFMPDGESIIAGVGTTLYEFETATGKLMRVFESPQFPEFSTISQLEVSPLGNVIVGKVENYGISVWDYKSGAFTDALRYNDLVKKSAACFAFHPTENKLYMLLNDTIILFDITSNKTVKFKPFPLMGATNLAVSKDGKYLGLAYEYFKSSDQKYHSKLFLYDAINFNIIKELDDITRDVRAIAFSPSSQYVAFTTTQDDGAFLRIYNLVNNTKTLYNSGFLGYEPFGIILLEGDSTILVSGTNNGFDRRTKLLNIRSGNSNYLINHAGNQNNIDLNDNNQILFDEVFYLLLVNNRWFTTSVPPDTRIKMNGNLKITYMNEVLSLDNTDSELIKLISIFDINGKLVNTYDAGYSGATVDLPFAAPAGVYLVRIVTDQSDYNFKFVRE